MPLPGRIEMSPAEEQQMLKTLTSISEDMKTLIAVVKELMQHEDAAEEKAYNQLVHIAHKRM
jgi:hypothetical protein